MKLKSINIIKQSAASFSRLLIFVSSINKTAVNSGITPKNACRLTPVALVSCNMPTACAISAKDHTKSVPAPLSANISL